ncbi:hypothetical protein U1Q18_033948 [Sarracenia purpurea var. burkii]
MKTPLFPSTKTHLRRYLLNPSFIGMTKFPYSKLPDDDDRGPPLMARDTGQPMDVEMAKTLACPMTIAPPRPTWKNLAEGFSSTPNMVPERLNHFEMP